MTNTNKIPRNIFVLIIATVLRTLDSLMANIWVIRRIPKINEAISSIENMPIVLVMIKNQNEKPALTANALNRGEDNSILNWINKCD
jgi:hypothetical protein